MNKKEISNPLSNTYLDFLPWDDSFLVNIPLIDKQHKKLITIINNLCDYIFQEVSVKDLESSFVELMDYTVYHFESEEKIWQSHFGQEKDYINHQHTHQEFIKELHLLKQGLASKPVNDVLADLVKYLVNWLTFHILDTDMRYSKIVIAMEKGSTFEEAKKTAINQMDKSKRMVRKILEMYDHLAIRTIQLVHEKREREKVNLELIASQTKEKSFTDMILLHSPGALCIFDSEMNILRFNNQILNDTSYSFDQMSNMSIFDITPKDEHAKILHLIDGDNEIEQIETHLIAKNGKEIPFLLMFKSSEIGGKSFYSMAGLDMSKHNENQEYLVQLSDQLIAAQKLGHIGSWELDLVNDELFWTDEVYNIASLSKDEFDGTFQSFLEQRVHPDDRKLVADAYSQSLEKRQPYSLIHRLLLPNDQIKFVHERGVSIYAEDGTPLRSLGTVQDISLIVENENKVKETLKRTIYALSETLGAKDPYTVGHEKNVSVITKAIAEKLGMDLQRIEGLVLGAMIHDIGKISIPSEILSNPRKLNKIEYEMIKQHPQAGADLVKNIEFEWPIYEMLLQHHERIDGSGYPQGLKGDEIIMEARILAVADTVEAMTNHRPYRPGLGIEKALAEIESGAGVRYDPEVTKVCVELYKSGELK